jgi:hypothetical protein
MKSTRLTLGIALLSLSTVAVAQSDAQKAFDQLKTLGGSWEGRVSTVPETPEAQGKLAQVELRVTSMGNALLHEMKLEGRPDDPITMFYVDGQELLLMHYCDAGNRPRMAGKASADGKTVEFDFLDVAGSTQHGHMVHAAFTILGADHHVEEWTWMGADGKTLRGRFDLQRTK